MTEADGALDHEGAVALDREAAKEREEREARNAHSGRRWRRYAAYRNSGVAWMGEIPAHWQTMRIKYLAPYARVRAEADGGCYVGLEHIQSGTGKASLDVQPENVDSTVTPFAPGDVLFGKLRPSSLRCGMRTE